MAFPYNFATPISDLRQLGNALQANFRKAINGDSFTAAGDTLVGTGAGQYAKLAAGANGSVFTRDDTQPGLVAWSSPVRVVTVLPASPYDGQVISYRPTTGVTWWFQYNASGGTYKWEFAGGGELNSNLMVGIENTTSVAYTALATAVTVTAPLAGVYQVRNEAWYSNPNVSAVAYCSFAVGATAASDNDALVAQAGTVGVNDTYAQSNSREKTISSAGTVIAQQFRSGTAGQVTSAGWRKMSIVPIRVG